MFRFYFASGDDNVAVHLLNVSGRSKTVPLKMFKQLFTTQILLLWWKTEVSSSVWKRLNEWIKRAGRTEMRSRYDPERLWFTSVLLGSHYNSHHALFRLRHGLLAAESELTQNRDGSRKGKERMRRVFTGRRNVDPEKRQQPPDISLWVFISEMKLRTHRYSVR